MTFEPGCIVLIPYPYSDLGAAKKRPVLVLTLPDRYGDFVGLAITSNPFHDHAVEITQATVEQGNLPKTSWVRTDKLFTLESTLVLKKIAVLSAPTFTRVRNAVCEHLRCE